MNQARNTIFNNIRNSLGRHKIDDNIVQTGKERLAKHTEHKQPNLGQGLTNKFIHQLEKVGCTLEPVINIKEIPFAVLEFLRQHDLPKKIVVDNRFKELPWPPNKLRPDCRAATAQDVVSVSQAFAGVVETGSLVLLSSPDSPTTLNFLPDNHIVVLYTSDIVTHIENVWARLRTQTMPRTVNFITGPSRTADIEQTIQLGVHGPRRLHVIWVGQPFLMIPTLPTIKNNYL